MIFVTVGASKISFERLIREMDRVASKIDEKVIMQIGIANYLPVNVEYFRFLPRNQIEELYKNASVIVCHAGIGTLLTALEHNKPIIAIPRLKEYGEHHDNHQLEIANELEKEGKIIAIYSINDLEDALHYVGENPVHIGCERMRLINALKEYIENLKREKSENENS